MKFKHGISIGTSMLLLISSLYSRSWSTTQNKHGFILKSGNTILYLGKSCDAMSPQYGTGEWSWKDNEIIVSLSKKDIYFNSSSLYDDGRCEKESSKTEEKGMSDSDKVALAGAALVVGAGLKWLFGGSSSSSSSSSSDYSSSPSFQACGTYDKCYKLLEIVTSREVKIQCTKGSYTGKIRNICANASGKWATGCGLTDVAAHYYKSFDKAAHHWCYW